MIAAGICMFLVLAGYLSATLVGALLLFDHLPRFLDTLLLFFIGPIATAYAVGVATHPLYGRLIRMEGSFHQSPLFRVLLILSLLIWLLAMPAEWLGMTRYLGLVTHKPPITLDQPEFEFDAANNAGFLSLPQGVLEREKFGLFHERGSVKRGANYTIFFNDFYAAPVTLRGRQLPIWLCAKISYSKDAPEEARKPPPFLAGQLPVRGFPIRDQYRQADCSRAIKVAQKTHDLPNHTDTILVEPSNPLEEELHTLATRTLAYLLLLNLLLAGLPTWLIHRSPPEAAEDQA